jgi:hypothetical protein
MDCLRPEMRRHREAIARFLFEDPGSETEQSGRLKLEGVWTNCLFRSGKAYYLDGQVTATREEARETVARMRSIPRKRLRLLEPERFGQDPRTNVCTVRGAEMRPSMGLEVLMLRQGRTLSHALNLKRKMTVIPTMRSRSFIFFPSSKSRRRHFQDPSHSLSL